MILSNGYEHYHRQVLKTRIRECIALGLGCKTIDMQLFSVTGRINEPNVCWYRKSLENDGIDIIDCRGKYIIFIDTYESELNDEAIEIEEHILTGLKNEGYTIYAKVHPGIKTSHLSKNRDYRLLPHEYAVESIVGGAKVKPDFIIGWDSAPLLTVSCLWGI